MVIRNVVSGAVGGAIGAFVGWAKNRKIETDQQEQFDFKYLIQTTFIGAALGALSVVEGIKIEDTKSAIQQTGVCASVVVFGEMVLKAIWRQGVPRVKDLLGAFKKA